MNTPYSNYAILVVDNQLEADTPEGEESRAIGQEIQEMDLKIYQELTVEDGLQEIQAHPEIGCILLDGDLVVDGHNHLSPQELIASIHSKNPDIPIFLMTDRMTVSQIPYETIIQIAGYIWRLEDSAQFVAGRIEEALRNYVNQLLPPFFGELVKYVEEYKYAWHTPGHMGGVAFLKSPVGNLFFNFFGENTFRSDLSVSVPQLGSLLEHSGVVGSAEAHASSVFGADRTYFVTNGTSTANRIIFNGCVSPGDIVLLDRNCHKSVMYSVILTGAIPIYLIPTRNNYGIIGPIHISEFDSEAIRQKLRDNPFTSKRIDEPFRLTSITNCTYDGLAYNVDTIKDKLSGKVKYLHFDEAWYGYARFHPLYQQYYAMSANLERPEHPIMFATQSTHKVLAAFSQGSMIHMRDTQKPENERLNPENFNEAFMMHSSTSPQYGIIASLDVAAQMMDNGQGQLLVTDALDEALTFRQKMTQITDQIQESESAGKKWWFRVWQPDNPEKDLPKLSTGKDQEPLNIQALRDYWILRPGESWHGFSGLEQDYVLLDPTKVTILTPGIRESGEMEATGIPASVVSRFLMNRGIVVEKTGFYSFLILFTIGITKGKSGTLLAELTAFKNLFDQNAPVEKVFPDLVKDFPETYKGKGLKELCLEIHHHLLTIHINQTIKDVYAKIPKMVMLPAEAYRSVVQGTAEEVRVKDIIGRTAAVMVVPYPPGIPIWMPGERLNPEDQDIQAYLQAYEDFDNQFPGFETAIHGVNVHETPNHTKYYTIFCVKD